MSGSQYEERPGKELQRARPILAQVIVAQVERERRQVVWNPDEIEGRQNEQSAFPGRKPTVAEYERQPCERRQQKATAVECRRLNPNIAAGRFRQFSSSPALPSRRESHPEESPPPDASRC